MILIFNFKFQFSIINLWNVFVYNCFIVSLIIKKINKSIIDLNRHYIIKQRVNHIFLVNFVTLCIIWLSTILTPAYAYVTLTRENIILSIQMSYALGNVNLNYWLLLNIKQNRRDGNSVLILTPCPDLTCYVLTNLRICILYYRACDYFTL